MNARHLRTCFPALIPVLLWTMLYAVQFAGGEDGGSASRRVFHADVIAMIAISLGACFLVGALRRRLTTIALAILLVTLIRMLFLGFDGALAWLAIAFLVTCVALGLARVGWLAGLSAVQAGVAPSLVLIIASVGIYGIDAIGETADVSERFPIKQALLNMDPATTCAHEASQHDRLHDPLIYDRVDVASSLVTPPTLRNFVFAWGPCALILLVIALLPGRRSVARPAHE